MKLSSSATGALLPADTPLSLIVPLPVPVPVPTLTPPDGVPRLTVTVSLPSAMLSVRVGTVTVALVAPAGMITLTGCPL